MFPRSYISKDRAGKATKPKKRSFRSDAVKQHLYDKVQHSSPSTTASTAAEPGATWPGLTSAIITIVVGREQRLFAAHQDVLCYSPYFTAICRAQLYQGNEVQRIELAGEEPEVFSCVLEYLYKGDYYPRLVHDKRRNAWMLEAQANGASPASTTTTEQGFADSPKSFTSRNTQQRSAAGGRGGVAATFFHSGVADVILRDTAIYCAADRYGLLELKQVALRKQGLQNGIEVGTILRSARYAYANTPDSDSRLRAHYLALIIRSRRTFKRSGTLQHEMEMGGRLFFDLFVAMCNHIDDIAEQGYENTCIE